MIFVATPDLADERSDLFSEVVYACRSFGLAKTGAFGVTPPPGLPVVIVQPLEGRFFQGETSLVDFTHPDECCYLFGATHGNMQPPAEPPLASVFIPAAPTWEMFVPQAVAVVLYDRLAKGGGLG